LQDSLYSSQDFVADRIPVITSIDFRAVRPYGECRSGDHSYRRSASLDPRVCAKDSAASIDHGDVAAERGQNGAFQEFARQECFIRSLAYQCVRKDLSQHSALFDNPLRPLTFLLAYKGENTQY
jgi:hypothetical protein